MKSIVSGTVHPLTVAISSPHASAIRSLSATIHDRLRTLRNEAVQHDDCAFFIVGRGTRLPERYLFTGDLDLILLKWT